MNKKYFTLYEFRRISLQDGDVVRFKPAYDVQEKILKWIFILNPIREKHGHAIIVNSAFRPHWWELEQGRSGTSEHVFLGDGAADIRSSHKSVSLQKHNKRQSDLAKILCANPYIGRIIFYPQQLDYNSDGIDDKYSFFHIDRKVLQDRPQLFVNDLSGLKKIHSPFEFQEIVRKKGM